MTLYAITRRQAAMAAYVSHGAWSIVELVAMVRDEQHSRLSGSLEYCLSQEQSWFFYLRLRGIRL